MKIILGSDHAGYSLKEAVREYLTAREIPVTDIGATYLPTGELLDPAFRHYPLVAERIAVEVAAGNYDYGIAVCGTGIGVSISANKIPGIRAACCTNHFETRYTRLHNDANILCLGARVVAPEFACELVDVFLHTDFEGDRHALRVEMIREIETRYR